ncbi:hypothetical protein DACRYDRAFT_111135 [Dacryopinax primogenitus]|uniref:Uncharacterized protein n=1 Tax=Dacryopinax primogenitus (strain DJM 731) TaxID=1858805 RepID=M5FXE7_DACPD|nr:uncharacterized protein DACRYDRAFT_111135 [Dacryopinax primogenitus]EJT98156.1 hypothetical protein DACRYDRAFT_111135 [Dacryopinax primogenitus]
MVIFRSHSKLCMKGSPDPIATFAKGSSSLLTSGIRPILVVESQALDMLDLVVLTWLEVSILFDAFQKREMVSNMQTEYILGPYSATRGIDY